MTTSNSQLQQRVEALEGEVNLLKSEIRQILIDMRDIWLRKSDVISAPQIVQAAAAASPTISTSSIPAAASKPQPYFGNDSGLDMSADQNNKGTLNDLLGWMGTSKEKGLTAARLFPILEAYENSGMISPLMAKFILKNMSMLDEMYSSEDPMSPSAYSGVVSELHKLVCISIDSA
ncbi:MAG: hypothetical protein ACJ0BB_03250 [Dehalococcoidia bacterium]